MDKPQLAADSIRRHTESIIEGLTVLREHVHRGQTNDAKLAGSGSQLSHFAELPGKASETIATADCVQNNLTRDVLCIWACTSLTASQQVKITRISSTLHRITRIQGES